VEFGYTEKKLDSYAFRLPDKSWLVAFWLPGEGVDDFADIKSDVILPQIKCREAVGIDVLNGTEQQLRISSEGGETIIRGVLIKDYPVIVRLREA